MEQPPLLLHATIIIFQIADFGMSRDLLQESYYISHGEKIPVRWTAPEVSRGPSLGGSTPTFN